MSRADEANDQASWWILAQEDGPWDDAVKAEFDAWMNESDANKAAYWRLSHTWREMDRAKALTSAAASPAPVAPLRRRVLPWFASAALAASVIAAVGYNLTRPQPDPVQNVVSAEYVTPVGYGKIVGLEDGSRIEINTASHVRAVVSDAHREVWLDRGEAYFEVKHVDGRPFVVHAGNRRITVLGTKFSVRKEGDRVRVAVVEGLVRVDEMKGDDAVGTSFMTRGDTAIAQGPATLLTDRSEDRVENILAWRSGMLRFNQTRLSDVAAEFNRYNVKHLVVADEQTGNIRIGGSFYTGKPEAFASLMRDAYGLRVEEKEDVITISN